MRLFKKLIKIDGIDNQLISPKVKTNHLYKRSPIEIHGSNNLIKIDPDNRIYKLHLIVNGDNNQITIGQNIDGILKIIINGSNIKMTIGKDCIFRGCEIGAFENNSIVQIGDGSIFARDTRLYASDFHTVYDMDTKQPLNQGTHLVIGNHVWLGEGSMVLKNHSIAHDTIIAARSLVTKDLTESFALYAGQPAVLKKKDVNWD